MSISQFASANFTTVVWLLDALAQFGGWSAVAPPIFSSAGNPKRPAILANMTALPVPSVGSFPPSLGVRRGQNEGCGHGAFAARRER